MERKRMAWKETESKRKKHKVRERNIKAEKEIKRHRKTQK
jgi:hypothetical protein